MAQAIALFEDEVDRNLMSQDGSIKRKPGKMCRHNSRSKCAHCLDVDPWDESYMQEKDIKHMSFHAYLRKITPAKGKGSKVPFPLENTTVTVDLSCSDGHKPWPEGSCQKCRPPPMRLNRQKYRHVDNINFENEKIVERFLDFWRKCGNQRIGVLLGTYEPYNDVPLGIRSIVKAIYEPPQSSTSKSVELDNIQDCNNALVKEICGELGLVEVGWIFCDLHPDPVDKSLMLYTRRPDTYLLTGEEVVTAAHLQNSHPNVSKLAREGTFGSRFVTVVASADENKHISLHAYQVSNQAASLELAGCLVPTLGASELVAVLESDESQRFWVPHVSFMEKDKYGNDAQKGPPLPVEYLLVDVPAGAAKETTCTFNPDPTKQLSVENRECIGQLQNFQALKDYASLFENGETLQFFSDIHLLIFLANNETCPVPMGELKPLLSGVKNGDAAAVIEWTENCTQWHTIQHIINEHQPNQPQSQGGEASGSASSVPSWACNHCTFQNPGSKNDCEICGLPKNNT